MLIFWNSECPLLLLCFTSCPTAHLHTESDRKQINRNKVWRLTSISRWRAVPGSSHSTLNFTPSVKFMTDTSAHHFSARHPLTSYTSTVASRRVRTRRVEPVWVSLLVATVTANSFSGEAKTPNQTGNGHRPQRRVETSLMMGDPGLRRSVAALRRTTVTLWHPGRRDGMFSHRPNQRRLWRDTDKHDGLFMSRLNEVCFMS